MLDHNQGKWSQGPMICYDKNAKPHLLQGPLLLPLLDQMQLHPSPVL